MSWLVTVNNLRCSAAHLPEIFPKDRGGISFNKTAMENNCVIIIPFSEELLLESQKLCSQLENVIHDTMKDQEQSFMVTYLIFFCRRTGEAHGFTLLLG